MIEAIIVAGVVVLSAYLLLGEFLVNWRNRNDE